MGRLLPIFPLSIFLIACVETPAQKVSMQILDLSPQARELLQQDFARLENTEITETAREANKIFAEEVLNRDTLVRWLNERVKKVVRPGYVDLSKLQQADPQENIVVLTNDHEFENPLIPPEPLKPQVQSSNIANNIGTAMYVIGKFTHQLFGVRLPGSEEFAPVSTPRIGLIELGEKVFDDWMSESIRFRQKELRDDALIGVDSRIASEFRLATLFHEARHADGNGKSLGFFHVPCPLTHELGGREACDMMQNGAYAIHGNYLKLALRDCRECGVLEKTVLEVFSLEAFNRVLPEIQVRLTPEETLRRCGKPAEGEMHPDECYFGMVPTEFWDVTPEGV